MPPKRPRREGRLALATHRLPEGRVGEERGLRRVGVGVDEAAEEADAERREGVDEREEQLEQLRRLGRHLEEGLRDEAHLRQHM